MLLEWPGLLPAAVDALTVGRRSSAREPYYGSLPSWSVA